MKKHSIKYNFIMKSSAMAMSVLVPLLIYPYVSRVLMPEGIGKVNFAQSVIYYFTVLAQLGTPTYGIRECAKVRDNKIELSNTVHEILLINILTSIISYTLLFACVATIPQLKNDKVLFLVMSITTIAQIIGVDWLYSGLEMYDYLAILSIAFKLLMIIGTFLFVKTSVDYVWYGAMIVVGTSGYGIVNFMVMGKVINYRHHGPWNIKKHLKPIIVFFAMSIAVTVYTQMDSVMLGFISGTIENGYYDSAVKAKLVLVSIITSLGTVIMPRASYHLEKGESLEFYNLSKKAMSVVVAVSVPLCIYFMMFARQTIMVLSGERFINSIMPMKLIMPTLVLIGMSNIIGIQMMVPMGKEKEVMYSEICGAVVNVIFNSVLIPHYGASGAAMGTVMAEIAVVLVMVYYIRDKLKILFSELAIARILCAVCLSAGTSFWIKLLDIGDFLKLLISSILFFGVYSIIVLPVYLRRNKV